MEQRAANDFWSGPVRTRARAELIISLAGWLSLVGGVWIPAAFLLAKRTRTAAIVLLVFTVLLALIAATALFAFLSLHRPPSGPLVAMAIAVIVYGLLTVLCWRAVVATGARRELIRDEWRQARRGDVIEYLGRQDRLVQGAVGEIPAWSVYPHVAVWAVESVKAPGAVGWWVIVGDLPTDYCSSKDCPDPRRAVAHIAGTWRAAVDGRREGDEVLGSIGIRVDLADMLAERADMLLAFTRDESAWPDRAQA
jgi:hypothetical protein